MVTVRGFYDNILLPNFGRLYVRHRLVIQNFRLGLCAYGMQAAFLLLVVWMAFFSQQAMLVLDPDEAGISAIWVDRPSQKEIDRVVSYQTQEAFCNNSASYDYDPGGSEPFVNYTCSMLPRGYTFWKEGPNSLYIPLSYRETSYSGLVSLPSGQSCSEITDPCQGGVWALKPYSLDPVCECKVMQSFFALAVESMNISLQHGYKLFPRSTWTGEKKSAQTNTQACNTGGANLCEEIVSDEAHARHEADLSTKVSVKNPSGAHYDLVREYLHLDDISLNLGEILAQAGVSLDSDVITASPNTLSSNSARQWPAARQTGLEIRMDLVYENRGQTVAGRMRQRGRWGPQCDLKIAVMPGEFTRPIADCGSPRANNSCTTRLFSGVQITFNAHGRFAYIDPSSFFVVVGSGMAWMIVPLFIVTMLAMYGLGPVSDIYRSAWREEVRIGVCLAGLAARIATQVTGWRAIAHTPAEIPNLVAEIHEDKKRQGAEIPKWDDGTTIITPESLLLLVLDSFNHRKDLKIEEKIRLAELVWERLDEGSDGTVEVTEFTEECTKNDTITIEDALALFDRSECCLERLLLPSTQTKASKQIFERIGEGEDAEFDMDKILQRAQEAKMKHLKQAVRKRKVKKEDTTTTSNAPKQNGIIKSAAEEEVANVPPSAPTPGKITSVVTV